MKTYGNGAEWAYGEEPFTQRAAQRALEAYEASLREREEPRLIYGALPDDVVPYYPHTPNELELVRKAARDPAEQERLRLLQAGRNGGA